MLMVHGAFVGGWCWEPMIEPFAAAGWRCHAPDLRHHDGAGDLQALGRTSLADYVDDLANAIEKMDAPPVLVGHSMGGVICQQLAARGLARALILLAPAPSWGILPSSGDELLARLALLQGGYDFWRKAIPPRFDYAAEAALDRFAPSRQRELFARFVPESGRALGEMLYWALDPHHASVVHAHRVDCPVLCLVGRLDRVTPPPTVRSIARRYAGRLIYQELEGHSHFLLGEPGFGQVTDICAGWLERVLTS